MTRKSDEKIINVKTTKKFVILKCYSRYGAVLVLNPPILTFPNIDIYTDQIHEWLELFDKRGYRIQ